MKVLLIFLWSFVVPLGGNCFYIELYGTVVEHFSGDPMKGVQVRVLVDGAQVFFKETKGNGKFKFVIDRETEYLVEFAKEYFVTKRVALNTKGIPPMSDIPFFEIELEMDLFPFVEGVDYSVLDEPMGMATYDDRIRNMRWDNKYKKRQAALYNKFWYQYEKAFNAPRSKKEKLPEQPEIWPPKE
jgi:hypothetical protein